MEEIYRAHFGFVWAVLRRLGVPDRDLEDVAQDVFVVVHRRLEEFEGRASTRTWLYAIAVRVAWNHARRRRVREPVAETSGSRLVAPPLGSDPEDHVVRTQAGRVLDELLARLDDDKRAVFVLSDIEGLTAAEIAEIVGSNPRTVYSRLRAARDRVHGDLARMQSREQSAAERRRWVRAASSGDAPAAATERRVWAALALRLPVDAALVGASGASAGLAGMGWSGMVQAVTVSVALGVAGLGAVWVAAAPLRDGEGASAHGIDPRDEATPTAFDPVADSRRDDRGASLEGRAGATMLAAPPPARADAPPARPTSERKRTAAATDDRAAAEDDALLAELPLLERARDALAREDPAAALREIDEHARRFPSSALATDRERLRAQARGLEHISQPPTTR